MTTSHIDLDNWIKEHLVDVIPMGVAIIDQAFNLVFANRAFEEMFGPWKNQKCYAVYKDRDSVCPYCKGAAAFKDGLPRVNEEVGYNKNGNLTYYIKHTNPVIDEKGNIPYLVEISTDITETIQIRKEYELLFDQVPCSILLIDKNFKIVKTNKRLRETLGDIESHFCYKALKGLDHQCSECTAHQTFVNGGLHTGHHEWQTEKGEVLHSQVITVPFRMSGDTVDQVMELAVDVTNIVKLEKEKVEAERLAAVGQTVAGLAHGVKNLITSLEGGMYMLNTGMAKGNPDRIEKGKEMLVRNVDRIALFVREFLSFSKGRVIKVKLNDPAVIAKEVVEAHAENAKAYGIELINEQVGEISPAPLDYEGIHECLTNLVSNAIDACRMSDKQGENHVRVKSFEKDGVITYEVTDDGCGMDYEVKQKVFTNFFTTKGTGGTGLGLLTTNKIIQEHGGKIDMESEADQGSTFRIRLPRNRLPEVNTTDEQK